MIESLIDHGGDVTIRAACAAFGVSESGFYAHRHKAQRSRRQQDHQIVHQMKQVFEENFHCYGSAFRLSGSPRLVKALKIRGIGCGKARIRLMVQEEICPNQKRRNRPRTTQSDPYWPCAPNVVVSLPPASLPQSASIATSLISPINGYPTKEGFLYLAATIDDFTRRCAGWCAKDNMETQLVKDAALMAFESGRQSECIHHSDGGSQYTSESFRLLLDNEQIVASMSRKANCCHNALIEFESFWATVKTECFDNFRAGVPATKAESLRSLFHDIERFYNRQRLHSALGYKSPPQFETDWRNAKFT